MPERVAKRVAKLGGWRNFATPPPLAKKEPCNFHVPLLVTVTETPQTPHLDL